MDPSMIYNSNLGGARRQGPLIPRQIVWPYGGDVTLGDWLFGKECTAHELIQHGSVCVDKRDTIILRSRHHLMGARYIWRNVWPVV